MLCLFDYLTDFKQVLITGRGAQKMEVIQPNGTTTICQASSHKQPLDIYGASGALVGTTMVSCGGSYPRTSACYSFSNDNQWRNLTKMSTPRYCSSAISVSDGIWVTGVVEIPMTKSQIHQNSQFSRDQEKMDQHFQNQELVTVLLSMVELLF